MAKIKENSQQKDEEFQDSFLGYTTMIAMIICNIFWIIVLLAAICINLSENETTILRNWNYLILSGCTFSTITLLLYIKFRWSFLLLLKILVRSCLSIIYIIIIIAQYFSKYNKTYSKTLQYLDLAFCICEFIYLCFMLTSVDNYYYEEGYKREKIKRHREYTDYSSI